MYEYGVYAMLRTHVWSVFRWLETGGLGAASRDARRRWRTRALLVSQCRAAPLSCAPVQSSAVPSCTVCPLAPHGSAIHTAVFVAVAAVF